MEFVKFKKVNEEINLPNSIENGSIYFVKDTGKIYADFDSARHAYSLNEEDLENSVSESVSGELNDLKTALEAVTSTLYEDVEDNYSEVVENLTTIGNYSTTAEVQQMINAANNKVSSKYGVVENNVIKLDDTHNTYKVSISTNNNSIDLDVSEISVPYDVIEFMLLIENPERIQANLVFSPATLDTSNLLWYNHKYVLLNIRGFKKSGNIKWTMESMGGWDE